MVMKPDSALGKVATSRLSAIAVGAWPAARVPKFHQVYSGDDPATGLVFWRKTIPMGMLLIKGTRSRFVWMANV